MANHRVHEDETRQKAILYWFAYRSWGKVSKKLGVPIRTLRQWSNTPWWEEGMESIRAKFQKKLDSQYTHILDKAAEKILHRVQHGDEKVTPSGKVVTFQVPAKDLSVILRDVQSNRALIRGEPTQRKETVSTKKKLDEIQNFFEKDRPDIKPAKKGRMSWIQDQPELLETPKEPDEQVH